MLILLISYYPPFFLTPFTPSSLFQGKALVLKGKLDMPMTAMHANPCFDATWHGKALRDCPIGTPPPPGIKPHPKDSPA
jgi:hypothetical protein